MSCTSLETLLAAIDQAIAEYDYTRNSRYIDSLTKETEEFRRASRFMRERINKEIRRRYQS